MRFISQISLISLFFMVFFVFSPANASQGFWSWFVPVDSGDFTRPYLQDGKTPHNSQWERDRWQPEDWIAGRGGSQKAVLDGLYAAGIIEEQYIERGVPVLEVGYNFIKLSDQEKNRVAKFVDHAFGITASNPDGMFLIETESQFPLGCNEDVGVYTRRGLQLQ